MNVKINITQLRYMLDNIPADQNIMLAGRHGIGKSEIACGCVGAYLMYRVMCQLSLIFYSIINDLLI